MYCAECGTIMTRREHGAWAICCNGIGYWWNQPPLVGDRWFGEPQRHMGYWLYKTAKWPALMIATVPKLEDWNA